MLPYVGSGDYCYSNSLSMSLLEAELSLARAQAHDPEEAMRFIARGYLGFAWRYPELYRLMYGLDGVTFSISEPEKEGLQIKDVVTRTVKEVLDSHGWEAVHLADQVNILWATGHGLVTLTLAGRIRGGQAQATHLFEPFKTRCWPGNRRQVPPVRLPFQTGSLSSSACYREDESGK